MSGPRSETVRRALGIAPAHSFHAFAPTVVRVLGGAVMAVHGIDELSEGPTEFGAVLGSMGVPAPTLTGWVVAVGESLGGLLLVVGLLSRWTALLLTAHLCVAGALVDADTGFTTPQQGAASGAGVEFPLMMGAAFLVVLLAGPGPLALDRALGIEAVPAARRPSAPAAPPSAVRASLVSGAIGGLIGAGMSALANYLVVGVPSGAGANAVNHAVSGLISGFLAGFLGLLTHRRRHARALSAEKDTGGLPEPLPGHAGG